jgi:cytoskeletal protein CcmA (bactofilin family)
MSESTSSSAPFAIPGQVVVEGGFRYPGSLVLNGTILGDVWCADLVVTERALVDGTIYANTVTVLGEVSGAIYANHVTLKTACSVTAEIFHGKLSLENGCFFEGKSRRMANPMSPADWNAGTRTTSEGFVP